MKPYLQNHLATSEGRSELGWHILRLTLASLIAAHGWVRFIGGGVVPFGEWLGSEGLPMGFLIAASVTAVEILGTLFLAARRFVLSLCVIYTFIYSAGITLVHSKAGWFVVGLGRNGVEYSVLIIVALLCIGLQHIKPGNPA
ncbi:MAG: DoxX family protein [Bacteroidota bacterium]